MGERLGIQKDADLILTCLIALFFIGMTGVGTASEFLADDSVFGVADSESVASKAEVSAPVEIAAPKATSGHRRMLTLLKQIADGTPDDNKYLGNANERLSS